VGYDGQDREMVLTYNQSTALKHYAGSYANKRSGFIFSKNEPHQSLKYNIVITRRKFKTSASG